MPETKARPCDIGFKLSCSVLINPEYSSRYLKTQYNYVQQAMREQYILRKSTLLYFGKDFCHLPLALYKAPMLTPPSLTLY